MKRLLIATIPALMFHAGLMALDFEWSFNKTIKLPKARSIAITVSLRQPSPKPVANNIKKELIKKRQIKPEKPKQPSIEPVKAAIMPDKIATTSDKAETIQDTILINKDDAEADQPGNITTYKGATTGNNPDNKLDGSASVATVTREAFPLYKTNPLPVYPRDARKRGFNGTVVLSVFVDESGRVKNLSMFTSSGFRILDDAALNAVKNWLFEPGMKGNRKAAMWVRVPIRFELK